MSKRNTATDYRRLNQFLADLGPVPEYMNIEYTDNTPAPSRPRRWQDGALMTLERPTHGLDQTGAPEATTIYTQAKLDDLERFLEAIGASKVIESEAFNEPVPGTGEHIIFALKSKPGGWLPLSTHSFEAQFKRIPIRGAYICTASVTMGVHPRKPDLPALRHKNEHFVAQQFFVLDDIGTGPGARVKPKDLPKLLRKPTAIVETSPENFQYSYRWATPIKDLAYAQEVIAAIYGADYGWDSGGGLPVKFVRLPVGVNSKRDETGAVIPGKTWFLCRLVECQPERTFTPEAVLQAVGHNRHAPENKTRRGLHQMRRKAGFLNVTWDGWTDPLLDFLTATGQVLGNASRDGWVDVACPWADEHTDTTDTTAGYKPLGVCSDCSEESVHTRYFKCHHNACSSRWCEDYLKALKDKYKESFPEHMHWRDHGTRLAQEYVFVQDAPGYAGGAYAELRTGRVIHKGAFADSHTLKTSKRTQAQHLAASPARVVVNTTALRPDIPEWLFRNDTGERVFNTYRPPAFEKVEPDTALLKPWMKYARYLIPNKTERVYVLNWMAAKVQDPTFRGQVLLFIAQTQGVGRSTFWEIYQQMFPPGLAVSIQQEALFGEWDDYRTKLLVVTDEAGGTAANRWFLSDRMKAVFEPGRAGAQLLNIKGSKQISARAYVSAVLLSNHASGVKLPPDDRRVYVVTNPDIPKPAAFFRGFNQWLEATPQLRQHLYWWFMQRDLLGWDGMATPPPTDGKLLMAGLAGNVIDRMVSTLLDWWPAEYIGLRQVRHAMRKHLGLFPLRVMGSWEEQTKASLAGFTIIDNSCRQYIDARTGKRIDRRQFVDSGDGTLVKMDLIKIRGKAGQAAERIAKEVDWAMLEEILASVAKEG